MTELFSRLFGKRDATPLPPPAPAMPTPRPAPHAGRLHSPDDLAGLRAGVRSATVPGVPTTVTPPPQGVPSLGIGYTCAVTADFTSTVVVDLSDLPATRVKLKGSFRFMRERERPGLAGPD